MTIGEMGIIQYIFDYIIKLVLIFLKHSNDIVFIKTMFFCLRYPWGGNVRDIVCLLLNAFTFLTQEEKNIGIV